MITEFQDGFITKTKLNELVGGINNNTERLAELDVIVLNENTTKTVGSGGDFTTLNLAIDWCKNIMPNNYNIYINILSGYKPMNGLLFEGLNLDFITIGSEDAIVSIDRGATVSYAPLGYVTPRKAFIVSKNSKTPIINTYFTIDTPSGLGDSYLGGILLENSESKIKKGFIDFDAFGLDCTGSKIIAPRSSFRSNRDLGTLYKSVNCRNGSYCNISYASVAGQGQVNVSGGGIISAYQSNGNIEHYSQTPNTITANGIIFK